MSKVRGTIAIMEEGGNGFVVLAVVSLWPLSMVENIIAAANAITLPTQASRKAGHGG